MSYTDLTGENFRRAHSALKQRKEQSPRDMTRTLEVMAVIVGIVLGALLLAGAANCGMARGAAWEVGDYATQPTWND
jgi:hypothetical protein